MSSPSPSKPRKKPELYSDASNSYYDPDFSVDISKKMRVPDKIKLVQNLNGASDVLQDPAIIAVKKVNEDSEWMRVPERICVVGGQGHISTREPPPELKLEHTFLGKTTEYEQIVQLTTPPRTLRIEDTAPVFETPAKQLDKALKSVENRTTSKSLDNRMNDSLMDYEDSELNSQNYVLLRRRLLQITQRLDSLEIENSRRNKRDFLLCTIGFLYLLFRGVNWFAAGRSQFRF